MRIAKSDLKKQSQFIGSHIDVILAITMVYGDLDD
jgi:hypothetical protein